MQRPEALTPLFAYPIAPLQALLPPATDRIWDGWGFRSRTFAQHAATRSIVARWLDNDWQPGAPPIVLRRGASNPLIAAIEQAGERIRAHFDGTIAKLMLVELAAGQHILPHRDKSPALVRSHRCHLAIETNDATFLTVDEIDHHVAPGMVVELDNTRRHAAHNRGTTRRVHLICDILPNGGPSRLVDSPRVADGRG